MMELKADTQIYQALKESINRYFKEMDKSQYADHVLWVKMIMYFLISISGYVCLLALSEKSLFFVSVSYLLFIFGAGLFIVNVAHDASHQALFKRKSVNRVFSYSWNFMGISKYLWEIKHHHSHHIYTNIPHQDADIQQSVLLRFSLAYPYRSYYKYQHLYALFLYFFFGFFIVYIKDFMMFFSKKENVHGRNKLPPYFFARLVFTKGLYLFISFIIPVMVLPFAWWKILIIYFVTLALSGSFMLLVLAVPHINENAALHESGHWIKNKNDWALHQIYSTVDSSANSRLLSWFSGGLNTHLVHHLFPGICHVHYLPLTKLIKQELCERGIKYKEKTFAASIVDHFKYLKLMGVSPRDHGKRIHSS